MGMDAYAFLDGLSTLLSCISAGVYIIRAISPLDTE